MWSLSTLAEFIYDSPDDIGHKEGHDTPAYYAKLRELNDKIGEIINAMNEAGIYDNSIIIFTPDHGGINKKRVSLNSILPVKFHHVVNGITPPSFAKGA